jgi:hypothetical protein
MATSILSPASSPPRKAGEAGHKWRVRLAALAAASVILSLTIYGFPYYGLSLEDRADSALHQALRPSGGIGLRLGILGFSLYAILFLYPLRKRWKWLGSIGQTRHWLDFHVLVGITAPIIISFHASFKLAGLAGVAYWIMMAVALSGFVGRYIYSQIPRSLNAVQLSMDELETQAAEISAQLQKQQVFSFQEIEPLLQVPSQEEVRTMSLSRMLWTILQMDLARPFRVSRLRRRVLQGFEIATTLGGLLRSGHEDLESVISGVRRQSWLRGKTSFLERTQEVFHLWHVVHRPFSYSFVVLVVIHVGVVLMLGYY